MFFAGLPGAEAMTGDAERLRGVVDEIAVPSGCNREVDTQPLADLSHPAGLNVGVVELRRQAGIEWTGHLVDVDGTEARGDQQWGIDGGRGHADRGTGLQPGEAEAVVAEPRQFGGGEDQLLQRAGLGARRQLAAGGW